MTCIRDLAQLEPLVDCCDAEQVMTDSAQLLEIDLYTTTKEQLDFQSKFEIKANRTDYAHALVRRAGGGTRTRVDLRGHGLPSP